MPSNPVRTAVEQHSESLERLTINDDTIQSFAAEHADDTFELPEWDAPVFPEKGAWSFDRTVDYFVVGNAINFCFNNVETAEKFEAERMGFEFDGAFGMWLCVYDETVNGSRDLTDAATLQSLTLSDLRSIFEPSNGVSMPLIEERLDFLHDIGAVMEEKESFGAVARTADGGLFGDDGFLTTLVEQTDAYGGDKRTLGGHTIPFDKRAQLAAIMLHGYFQDSPLFTMQDVDLLTLPADYGVPNTLRGFDILSYDEELQEKVDSQTPLTANSREEVEIRTASVLATEKLQAALNDYRGTPVSIPQLDYFLWSLRRESPYNEHLTETTAY